MANRPRISSELDSGTRATTWKGRGAGEVRVRVQLTIGPYVSVRSSRYEARGKFGEHERCLRVARGYALILRGKLISMLNHRSLIIPKNTVI